MADRLPFGQVTPTARPIGAFVQPAQFNTAAPARPFELPAARGIDTLQIGGTTNVQGVNQFQQLATALAPFTGKAIETAAGAYLDYAKGKIEEGYYQEVRNQAAKASASLQAQAEIGAANAASTIGTLQKRDPGAAQLLKEANPWMLIGRRRAVAQKVAIEADDLLEDDLAANGGMLAQLKPGNPAIKARTVNLLQQKLGQYGLTGDEPEVNFYVTPAINKAMENYTDKQRKLYSAAVEQSTTAATVANLGAVIRTAITTPVTIGTKTYQIGSFEWREINARDITERFLDPAMRLLDPEGRKRALETIRREIVGAFGGLGFAGDLVKSLRAGDASMPYEKRPSWGESAPLEVMELQARGQKAALDNYTLAQQSLETKLDKLWMGTKEDPGPGAFLSPESDPRYAEKLQQFVATATALGYGDVASYVVKRSKIQSEYGELFRPADPFEAENMKAQIRAISPGAWTDDPNAYKNAQEAIKRVAMREPTRDAQRNTYRDLMDELDKARSAAGELDKGVMGFVENQVMQDLDSQAVREIRDKQKVNGQTGSALAQAMQQRRSSGASATEAVAAVYQDAKLTAFSNRVRELHVREISDAINQWKADNPGRALGPAQRSVVMSGAAAAVRKSPEYAQAVESLTGRKFGSVGPATLGTGKVGTDRKAALGVPRERARSLSDQQVRGYTQRPTMSSRWTLDELKSLEKGKPFSAELIELAKRAKTTPLQYLRENLRYWAPGIDPSGAAGRYLDDRIKRQRSVRTVAGNQVSSILPPWIAGALARRPLDPGGWLIGMVAPPAMASTVPTIFPQGGGMPMGGQLGGTPGSFERPESVVFEKPGPKNQPGVDFWFASKRFPAMLDGRVKDVSREARYGNYVVIESIDPRNGRTVDVLYAHLPDGGINVRPGQKVSAGQIIGRQGGTGNVVSSDGTIASVDFLAPRPAGSKDMTPYQDFDGLRRWVAGRLQSGGGGAPVAAATTRAGGGMTGLATFYTGGGGQDGVAGGPTANGERYNPKAMTAAVQWSLRSKYLNKWLIVEDIETGKSVRVWANDVGQMGGSERSVNRQEPRVIDLSPAAFTKLFGSTSKGVGRIRVRIDQRQRGTGPRASAGPAGIGDQFVAKISEETGYEDVAGLQPLPVRRMLRQAGRPMDPARRAVGPSGQPLRKKDIKIDPTLHEEVIKRNLKVRQVIDSWDPIEAEWKQRKNNWKGPRRPPVVPTDEQFRNLLTPHLMEWKQLVHRVGLDGFKTDYSDFLDDKTQQMLEKKMSLYVSARMAEQIFETGDAPHFTLPAVIRFYFPSFGEDFLSRYNERRRQQQSNTADMIDMARDAIRPIDLPGQER